MKSDDYFRKLDQVDPRRLRVSPPPTPTAAWIEEYHRENAPQSGCECDICEKWRHVERLCDLLSGLVDDA